MTKTKTVAEKIFTGNRPLSEIKRRVKEWDQKEYDRGGDWIKFLFLASTGESFAVLYQQMNGKFIIKHEGKIITESSTEYDKIPWYAELLDLLYTSGGKK